MALPPWLAVGAGVVGSLGFTLMMLPQILLNRRKRSTEGLSLGLVGIWHFASCLMLAFYVIQTPPPPAIIFSMAVFCLASAIIEGQVVAYRPQGAASSRRNLVLLSASSAMVALSLLVTALLVMLLLSLPPAGVYLIGDVLASALLALGFLPQMYEFLVTWSIDGYSFGVTAFDCMGCAGNIVTLFAPPGVRPMKALAAAVPFLTIIGMHVILLLIAGTILLSGRGQRCEMLLLPEAADDLRILRSLSGKFHTPSSVGRGLGSAFATPSSQTTRKLSDGLAYKPLP